MNLHFQNAVCAPSSPLPWTAEPGKDHFGLPVMWIHARGAGIVGTIRGHDDGAYVARAVNAHDDLLEACRRLLKFNEELATDVGVSTHYPSADFARKAIAKAEP